jgi:predicted Zn-dependent protease
MKKKLHVILIAIILSTGILFSCGTVAVVAQIAGAVGLVDPNLAAAVAVSATAIGSAAEEITPEQEYFIGRAVSANILSTYRIWDEKPELTEYLNLICNAIVINSPRPDIFNGYKVAILDTDEINAFASSGGHIFITRGLVNAANSEDALAAVIAHEIAHIQLQHGIRAIRTSRITQALLVTGTAAAGVATGMNVNELTDVFNETVGEIVTTMVNNGFSQSQEFDADNTAMALMAASGYNPSALIEMLQSLTSVQRPGVGFGRTHPTPEQRINNANRTINNFNVPDNSAVRRARFAAATR